MNKIVFALSICCFLLSLFLVYAEAIGVAILAVFIGLIFLHVATEKSPAAAAKDDLADRKEKAEDLIWKMSPKELILTNPDKLFPEHVDLVNDLIRDHMEMMSAAQLRSLRPVIRRFHEELLPEVDEHLEKDA